MCGISGFIPKNNNIPVNFTGLLYTLMAQDTRGGHSMGIAYTTKSNQTCIQWGIRKDNVNSIKKFFEVKNKDVRDEIHEKPFVLAHSRKPSAGYTNFEDLDGCHPFIFPSLIGVHNGTVKNTKELAEYYGVDISTAYTDSEQLYKIIDEKGTECLKYYEGAATLVWKERKTGDIKMWAGKMSNYATSALDRPLHFLDAPEGLYISSEMEPLEFLKCAMLNRDEAEDNLYKIYVLKGNSLITFSEGEIKSMEDMDRVSLPKKQVNKAETVSSTKTPIRSIYPVYNRDSEEDDEDVNVFGVPHNTIPFANDIDDDMDEENFARFQNFEGGTENEFFRNKENSEKYNTFFQLYTNETNTCLLHNINIVDAMSFKSYDSELFFHGLHLNPDTLDDFFNYVYTTDQFTSFDISRFCYNPVHDAWADSINSYMEHVNLTNNTVLENIDGPISLEDFNKYFEPRMKDNPNLYCYKARNDFYSVDNYEVKMLLTGTTLKFNFGTLMKEYVKH